MKRKIYLVSGTAIILSSLFVFLNLLNSLDYEWPKSSPVNEGIDSKKLNNMDSDIKKNFPHIYSFLVIRNHKLIFEKYYNSFNKKSIFKLNSATKTVTSALVGIALKEGYLKNVDESISVFFPEYISGYSDPGIGSISIRNILTMTSGMNWNVLNDNEVFSNNDLFNEVWGKNPIQYFLSLKCAYTPGEVWEYSNLAPQVLAGIISRSSKMTTKKFADKFLFGPLGIDNRNYQWETDPQGNFIAAWGLYLRARDLAKIGQLYLNKGSWNGRQIFTKQWYNDSTGLQNDQTENVYQADYGFLIWEKNISGYPVFYASGTGGQYIFIVPALNLVAVSTGKDDQEHYESEGLLQEYVLPAVMKKNKTHAQ